MSGILTIAHLTLHEARRRRIVLAAAVCGIGFLAVFGTGMWHFINRGVRQSNRARSHRHDHHDHRALRRELPCHRSRGSAVRGHTLWRDQVWRHSDPRLQANATCGCRPRQWLGYWVCVSYLMAMAVGVVLIVRVITGYMQPGLDHALPLMALEATVLLTITIAGGTLFSAVTNGIVAFPAFTGWRSRAASLSRRARSWAISWRGDIGTAVSLIGPADTLWRMAAYYLVPAFITNLNEGPPMMWSVSAPTAAMVVWSVGFVLVVLAFALRTFNRRAL